MRYGDEQMGKVHENTYTNRHQENGNFLKVALSCLKLS